ncbi:hypothetical protein C4J98_2956 [Pseudomonas orientalis]|nr:hypothetical protein C4J98_2956 [Pseudomonas orientalis]
MTKRRAEDEFSKVIQHSSYMAFTVLWKVLGSLAEIMQEISGF